ncbi:GTPase [Flavobacterium subsaxonicum]|uniref:AIG1-type G domain-containing protein n=1 Tax=Flavobacterium subsaxonicum WB 4.1-42 = DSM 21790 TaxID=1121898 RepID=A0A0A2MHB9_9FLAO|nr:GTPase [Flavobacterium subsaxonicum]KGO91021.1 hypothetical protein Q766_20240 [Flavobacterium subsaxonicum WB 4.1-42 = DSM 21790]
MENQAFENHDKSGQRKKMADETLADLNKKGNNKFTLLLVGRTGVGKSSSIDTLLGKEVAKVNDSKPETMKVTKYPGQTNDIKYDIIDTPGLCDDFAVAGHDEAYLNQIIENVKSFDLMWFVAFFADTRVSADEMRAIKMLHKAFGKAAWDKTVLVLTFSNSFFPPADFAKKLESRTEAIQNEIGKHCSITLAPAIPSVAIDNAIITNPDGQEWLGELYTTIIERISANAALPFIMATASRLKVEKPDKFVLKTA